MRPFLAQKVGEFQTVQLKYEQAKTKQDDHLGAAYNLKICFIFGAH